MPSVPPGLLRDLLDLRARLIGREARLDAEVAVLLSSLYSKWEYEIRRIIGGTLDGRPIADLIARRAAILSALRRITTAETRRVSEAIGKEVEAVYRSEVYRVASILSTVATNPASVSTLELSFDAVNVPAVRAALAGGLVGAREFASLSKIPARVESLMRKDLARSIANGYNVDDLIDLWKRRSGAGAVVSEIRAVARTSVMAASNAAHLDTYRENSDLVDGVRFEATFDRRTCMRCGSLHGREYLLKDAPHLPVHFMCVLPGNMVSPSSVLAASKAFYSGEVVEVRTAGGRRFSVTKKHPVLTSRGWIRAVDVQCGDDLVHHPATNSPIANPDDHNRPTKIEEVFSSLEKSVGVRSARVPVSPEHLHGDGGGIQGDVHVVWPNGLVPGVGDPSGDEAVAQIGLGRTSSIKGPAPLSALGHSDRLLDRLRLSAYRVVGGLSESKAIGGGGSSHACEHCGGPTSSFGLGFSEPSGDNVAAHPKAEGDRLLALAPLISGGNIGGVELDPLRMGGLVLPTNLDSGLDQSAPDCLTTTPDEFRDLLGTLSGDVSLDRVVHVDHSFYSGHVYDLQTVSGTINCGGLIIHNCRCVLLPIFIDRSLNSEVYSIGAYQTPSGGVYFAGKDRNFEKFLRSRTPDFRADFFPSDLKRRAFESRKLTLSQMLNRDGSIKTDRQVSALLRKK